MIQSTAAPARALRRLLTGLVLGGLSLSVATAADPLADIPAEPFAPEPTPAAGLVEIQVYPAAIDLTTARDRQSIVVQGFYSDGLTRDLTADASYTLANPALVTRDGATFRPAADGETTLAVAFGDKSAAIPVKVGKATVAEPLSFRLDVMPVFMRAGCNTGSCHGAARGKDGFRISLFGFDPEGDYFRLTREMVGRRINTAVPADSTLLEKSVGAVQHTGGKRFEVGDDLYKAVHEWITVGAPNDDVSKLPKVVGVELYPKKGVMDGKGSKQQLTVLAKYSDGTDRDVTGLAVFLTNNETSAAVTQDGLVTAGDRGEAFVMARFETYTVGSQFIVLPKGLQFTYPDESTGNYIDELVAAKLQKLRIAPSELCDDATYARRVFIDVVGLTPTVEELEGFIASTDPDKRGKLVDELLKRKEFSEIWVSKWAELLQIRTSLFVSYKSMFLYYNWLVEKLSKDMPMDEMVQELLGASGGTFKNPATNFYQTTTETLPLTENVAQVFMGMRIQCAQCHNHPFDRWTQDDYYGFAAFFSQIGKKQGEDVRELIVFNSGGGEMNHPVGGRAMKPKFLGGEEPDVAGKDRREVLAKWLASPQNPWFAASFANRVWAHFMGVGIVEPVDDFRVSNPASNPELLEALGKRFTESKYNLKALVKDICTSRAYQRSTRRNESNESDEKNFAHALVRRIKAESLLDTISHVTNTKDKFQGLPTGARAVQIADGNSSTYFLTTFGRATRETPCSCEVKMEPTLSQALHLMNGDTVNAKIQQGGVIAELMKLPTPEERLTSLYLRCFSRRPTADELAKLTPAIAQAPDQAQALGDMFWALLNSREFLFNH
ncbi:MAG: cell surface protein [Planctomycetales bacterium 71-10]|nr:MAG: cell surface protein [Planctomycetales bacterium 71-10]